MEPGFIDLDRSFGVIPEKEEYSEEYYQISESFGLSGPEKKWDDLLELKRVIILAEAGAGKTAEITAISERLRQEGKAAFFLRLESLETSFESSFEIGNNTEFNEWVQLECDGWFFLDSVDEARLTGPNKFEAAVRFFGNKLGENKQRASVFVTSRISEWRYKSDFFLIKRHIPLFVVTPDGTADDDSTSEILKNSISNGNYRPDKTDKVQVEPAVFALRRLNRSQITKFADFRGVSDSGAFVSAVEKEDALLFAERPLDLIELIDFWNENGVIANRAKLIDESISRRLKETSPDRGDVYPLSIEDARAGAERLAASLTFQKINRILVPEPNHDSSWVTGVTDVKEELVGWNDRMCRALLQRPIFDEAIYGTVRFHHRSVREYLTAKWLHRLLQQGKSRFAIENLFFKELYGRTVLVPSMRPILSWLVIYDDRIRSKTMQLAPEVLINDGDPSELPLSIRKELLRKYCKHYENDKTPDTSFNITELKRFGHKDLGETINELLDKHQNNKEIVQLLLRIIWQNEIEFCAEKAIDLGLNEANDVYTRVYAIRAVSSAGSYEQKAQFFETISKNQNLKEEKLIAETISSFSPKIVTVSDFLALIRRIKLLGSYNGSWIKNAVKEYCSHKFPDADLLNLICGLSAMLKEQPFIEKHDIRISKRFGWVLPFAALAAERLVKNRDKFALNSCTLEVISLSQTSASYIDMHFEKNDLKELVPKWPELNRALFWFDVAESRKYQYTKDGSRVTKYWQAHPYNKFWKFSAKDFNRILDDIRDQVETDDRSVALSLAYDLYRESGRQRQQRYALKKAVQGVLELEDELNTLLNPPPMSPEIKRTRRRHHYHDKKQKEREEKRAKEKHDFKIWLRKNINILRDTSIAKKGKVWQATAYLVSQLSGKTGGGNSLAVSDWEGLIPEYGLEVAEAFRDGCIDYWRRYRPEIRSESIRDLSSIPYALIIGLSGLNIEANSVPKWPNNLSDEEAALACRYSFRELNGFPEWFQKLHAVFPDIIESSVLKEIEWEFAEYDDDKSPHYILNYITWQADWIRPKIANNILTYLENCEPKHLDTIKNSLDIVLSLDNINIEHLINIANSKIALEISEERKALWLAAWMCVNSEDALIMLKSHLNDFTDHKKSADFSMRFITALIGERSGRTQRKHRDFLRPNVLLSLVKLMHQHIRSEEDLHHTDVYTPGLRDHAQEARGRLFQLLLNIRGKETYLALLDLAGNHPDEDTRHWYFTHAKRHAEADAEIDPWRPGDVIEFAEDAERTPNNHRELYDFIVSRLLDLKFYLEEGDTSFADFLIPVKEETKQRVYIGGWLRENSHGRYIAPQEEELADGTKPDIRIHGIGFDGPVPIELKIADNKWTAADLEERLKNQLRGQYLRDARSNCGIYLLIYLGKKKSWKHPKTGKKLDFNNLIQFLKEEAHKIVMEDSKIESLEVLGIDLTRRRTPKTN